MRLRKRNRDDREIEMLGVSILLSVTVCCEGRGEGLRSGGGRGCISCVCVWRCCAVVRTRVIRGEGGCVLSVERDRSSRGRG